MRFLTTSGILYIAIFCCCFSIVESQTPANDLNWVLDTAKSDDFNGISVNQSKWHVMDCPSGDCCNFGGGTAFEKGNATVAGGLLRLRIDGPAPAPAPCNLTGTYATGGIWSDSTNYSYGYYEMRAQLPGFYNSGVPTGQKLWPAFWTAFVKYDTSCLVVHNEIDIVDPGALYSSANQITSGWWYQNGRCGDTLMAGAAYNSIAPFFTGFHKFAAQWLNNTLVFYCDDKAYLQVNSNKLNMYPQQVFIDQQILDTNYKFPTNTPFPLYTYVDYFHYYKLNLDCSTSVTMLNNTDLAAFNFAVKSDITFGNGLDSIKLNSTDVKYFRAVNTITINGSFTAPLGSELGLIPTPCN